ncbi:MAG: PorV/PorQ family protein, partial [Bacteroidota bacterium]
IVGGVCLACLLLFSSRATAQVRKFSNEFLAIGVGARALAMSNAQVASVNDVTAGYWNPAGLLRVEADVQLAAMHAEYFAGIAKYDYGAFATKIDSSSALGISIIRFGVDDIPNTTELIDAQGNIDYNRITSFSASDWGFMFSYAKRPNIPGLGIGGSAKVVHRRVGDMATAWGFGLDLGAQYERNGWMFGAMARDITSTFNAWTFDLNETTKEVFEATDNELPENSLEITLPKLILAAGRKFIIRERVSIHAEMSADFTFDGQRNVLISNDAVSVDPNFGLEVGYLNFVFLRGGLGNIQRVKSEIGNFNTTTFQPNIGIGIKIRNFYIDYALTDIGDQSVALFSNIFSLKLDIYKKARSGNAYQ